MSVPRQPDPIAVRVYARFAEIILPRAFNNEYGGRITVVFSDAWRDARRNPVGLPLLILWLREFLALTITGIRERLRSNGNPLSGTGGPRDPKRGPHPRISDMATSLMQDIRYALRGFVKSPMFTIVAVTTLALGIGANTAIFSVVNGVLLQPLPYYEHDNLVAIYSRFLPESGRDIPEGIIGSPEYFDYLNENRSMESVAAISTKRFTITEGDGDPEVVTAGYVSADMFSVLRTPPLLGRTLISEDDGAEPTPVFVLSYDFWQRRFGGDPGIIGRTLAGGIDVGILSAVGEIVGVMPEGFSFPSEDVQLWTQLPLDPARTWRGGHWFYMIGRLADGVSYEAAQADMATIMADWEVRYPNDHTGHFLFLKPLLDDYIADIRPALLLLLGAVGFVLLIVCANVANILLARGEGRRREIAVRRALGAGRSRLVQQLLTECLLLAVIGGAAGVVLARIALPVLLALEGGTIPRVDQIVLDGRVLAFSAILVLLTAMIFSLVPTLQGAATNISGAFHDRSTSTKEGKQHLRFRAFLIVTEMALAIMLVIGAGLMVKSYWRLLNEDPGFRTDNLLTAFFSLPAESYAPEQAREFYGRLTETVSALPGVENAALVSRTPMESDWSQAPAHIEGWERPNPAQMCCTASAVWGDPGIFRTFGTSLVAGRLFDETDLPETPSVIVIDETLARTYWPDDDPIGKRMTSGGSDYYTVVGIVRHIQYDGLGTTYPTLYMPFRQMGDHFVQSMVLAVRTAADPTTLVAPLRETVRSLDPNLAIVYVRTMDDVLSREVARPKFTMTLLGMFAFVALILGVIGVYGVMSHAVAARTNEIGIRVALGARGEEVTWMVTRQGFLLAMAGVAVGLGCALLASRVMTGLLFEVSATDPWTFCGVALLMALVALLASYLPARRASRVDPIEALRAE